MVNVLEWSKINLSINVKDSKTNKQKERRILKNIAGNVTSGQLLAIMGPTGCGKSSLMSVLSGKVSYNRKTKLTGIITYNGEYLDHGMSTKTVACVAQDETMFAFLTVRETLTLACYFHSPGNISKEERDNRVVAVMRELGLSNAADTLIGNENQRGVSGGEYKRVLIGKELIKSPTTIFVDEPTSGLDSFQALSVMETMKKMAANNRIVVSVIHQPRSSIFAMFDRLLLLSDGKLMFFGQVDQALTYFRNLGYDCPQHFNPADYYLDILSLNTKTVETETETKARITFFENAFILHQQSSHGELEEISLSAERKPSSVRTSTRVDEILKPPEYSKSSNILTSWFQDFSVLLWRANVNIYRNYGALIVRGATSLFFAVLISLIYRDLSYDQRGIQNRAGLLYFVLINQGFSPLIGTLTAFPSEKFLVSREVLGGSYRFSSYYLARVIAEIPMQIVVAVIYCTIIYWSTGLHPLADRFFIFASIVCLSTLNACSLGFLISAISPNAVIANAIGPPVFIILLLYGGFYINASSLPVGSVWVRNLSLVYWGFQAVLINEFKGETFTCDASTPGQCRTTGEEVITSFSFQNGSINLSAGVLLVLTAGYFALGYFALLFNQQRYRRIKPPDADNNDEAEMKESIQNEVDGEKSIHDIEDGHEDGNWGSIKLTKTQYKDGTNDNSAESKRRQYLHVAAML
eukprot:gene7161-7918_t